MDIGTQDAERIVNVGSAADFYSLYSTASTIIGRSDRDAHLGLAFLESGSCRAKDCAKTAYQLGEINDELTKHAPADAVWDMEHPNVLAPWSGNIAPSITNCVDLYTTSEGDPLLSELIDLLQYAVLSKQSVVVLG